MLTNLPQHSSHAQGTPPLTLQIIPAPSTPVSLSGFQGQSGTTDRTACRPGSPLSQPTHHVRSPSSGIDSAIDGLESLRQAAQRASQRVVRNWRQESTLQETFSKETLRYASPLAPLRERDEIALAAWFQREDIHEIETDIAAHLLKLLPEPCWEDNPLDFLKEFL